MKSHLWLLQCLKPENTHKSPEEYFICFQIWYTRSKLRLIRYWTHLMVFGISFVYQGISLSCSALWVQLEFQKYSCLWCTSIFLLNFYGGQLVYLFIFLLPCFQIYLDCSNVCQVLLVECSDSKLISTLAFAVEP